jgi:zinc transport system substrate-binding protein
MALRRVVFLVIVFVFFGSGLLYFLLKVRRTDGGLGRLRISASFYPYYFFTKAVVGDKFEIFSVTPFDTEPHDYELTPLDIAKIETSRLLVMNGAIEPWAKKIKDDLKSKGIRVVSDEANFSIKGDPHVWLDPLLAKKQVDLILKEVVLIDPLNKDYYTQRANKIYQDLDKLDRDYRAGLRSCRFGDIVTSHSAFGYLAKEYNLRQVSIAGISPDSEPSLKQLAGISAFVRSNGIKYIFFESLVSPKLSETIANETGAKTLVLNPVEGLTWDETRLEKDYFDIMRENLSNLRTALSCL